MRSKLLLQLQPNPHKKAHSKYKCLMLSQDPQGYLFRKSDLGWCPVYKAASSNVFAHFCSDYFDEETCQNKHIKMKDYEGGFRSLDDFREKVRL